MLAYLIADTTELRIDELRRSCCLRWIFKTNMETMIDLTDECRTAFISTSANGYHIIPMLSKILFHAFGGDMSIPISLIASTALEFTLTAGLVPAE